MVPRLAERGEERFHCMLEKQILIRVIGIKKQNWGVTTQFSEIINLQFGQKRYIVLCILQLFQIVA